MSLVQGIGRFTYRWVLQLQKCPETVNLVLLMRKEIRTTAPLAPGTPDAPGIPLCPGAVDVRCLN